MKQRTKKQFDQEFKARVAHFRATAACPDGRHGSIEPAKAPGLEGRMFGYTTSRSLPKAARSFVLAVMSLVGLVVAGCRSVPAGEAGSHWYRLRSSPGSSPS